MGIRRDNAIGLYMDGIRDGHPQAALEAYIGDRYTQHSTGVADGKAGFLAFFEPFLARSPQRDIQVLRTIEDGRHVFCHVSQSLNGGTARWITMDLFDTDDAGRIIEHWDTISAWEDTVSGNGMTEGGADLRDLDKTEANKAIVLEYTKRVRQMRQLDLLGDYVSADLIQHHPQIPDGRSGLEAYLRSDAHGRFEMLFKLIGEGNFVVTLSKRHTAQGDQADFDLYRLEGGRIVEQWSSGETILDRAQWGNSGKF